MFTYLLMKLKGKEFILFLYISILVLVITSLKVGVLYGIFIYFTLFICYFVYSIFRIRRNNYFRTYFGVPGSGKSTMGTYYAIEVLKQNKKIMLKNLYRMKKNKPLKPLKKVFSNISIPGTIPITKDEIKASNEALKDCLLIYDEVGIDYNNRNFSKNFDIDGLKLFKYHRKRNIDIMIFSQSYSDMDLKLRDLSTELYFLKKSAIPFFIKSIRIDKFITIDKETQQIIDGYKKRLFGGYYVFMPKTWRYFDTKEEK